ncbi:YDG domain-containing protein [Mycena chlorophos]|uniref:YDG domain-containing protein n=1 Tax=Mycena chlorophos TaxID=658473 RepID=A0A8H6TV24_MYCCL|nr:YDG domain-containing protein [Mycena chlorophos]
MDSPTRGKNTARRSRSWRTVGSNSRRTRSQAIPKPAYIQNLPNELLTEIFMRFLPQYPAFPPLVGPNSPTCLLGVCRRWRNLALHTATLWRAIKVGAGDSDQEFAVALTWLERSCPALLHLHVMVDKAIPATHPPLQQLFEAVVANRMRWQYLTLVVEEDQAGRFSGPAPNLEYLEIVANGDDWDPAHSFLLVDAVTLRELVLWNVAFNNHSVPWAQLTSLTLLIAEWLDIHSVLSHCTSLIYCKISFWDADPEEFPQLKICLPHLKILVLSLNADDDEEGGMVTQNHFADTLRHFTLPSLQRLEISDSLFGVGVPQLEALIERSQCKLRSLYIASAKHMPRGFFMVQECANSDVLKEIDVACLEIDEDLLHGYYGYWQEDVYWESVPEPEESKESV